MPVTRFSSRKLSPIATKPILPTAGKTINWRATVARSTLLLTMARFSGTLAGRRLLQFAKTSFARASATEPDRQPGSRRDQTITAAKALNRFRQFGRRRPNQRQPADPRRARAHLEGTTKTGGWKPPALAGRRPALRSRPGCEFVGLPSPTFHRTASPLTVVLPRCAPLRASMDFLLAHERPIGQSSWL